MANAFDQFDQAQSAAPPAGNAFDQFDAPAAAPAAASTEAAPNPSLLDRYSNGAASFLGPTGVVETAAAIGSNMVAQPLAGLSGLVQKGLNVAGIDNTHPAEAVRQVQDALTYQPKTYAGQAMTSAIAKPFEWLAKGADWAGDQVNNMPAGMTIPTPYGNFPAGPGLATVVNTAIQGAPSLLIKGPKGGAAATAIEAPKPVVEPRVAAAQAARDAGFSLSPNQAGGKVGKLAEGLTGQAKLERQLSLKNAPRVNEMAAKDIGLEGKSITKGDLNRAKVEANKPYNELARTGVRTVSDDFRAELADIAKGSGGESFAAARDPQIKQLVESYSNTKRFTAQDAISEVRQLRKDGFANKYGKYDPEKNAKGDAQLKIADALDNELERHADSLGKPELAAKYKAARVQLAKIATVEKALRGSDVSALALAKAQKNGAKLSGNLKTIADSATEFEKSFQEVRKIRDQGDLSVVDYFLGLGGAVANPALAAGVLARPAARRFIASDAYQRNFIGRGQSATKPAPLDVRQATPAVVGSEQKRASK